MHLINNLLQFSLDEIKSGYFYDQIKKAYICTICRKEFEEGEIFSFNNRFFEASKAIQLHVDVEHGSMLNTLLSYDKKYTGLTENQKDLFKLLHQGLSDNEIAVRTGVVTSTVRHQRFIFRERAKQAKLYLAMFELLEDTSYSNTNKQKNEDLIDIHAGAKMVDDRYLITKAEEEKIIKSSFESLSPLKLKLLSSKEKKKIVILRKISEQFDSDLKYSEKEINTILKPIYDDYATIRRYLIEYGFLDRTNDCKEYWIK